jgi:hypothetical protein
VTRLATTLFAALVAAVSTSTPLAHAADAARAAPSPGADNAPSPAAHLGAPPARQASPVVEHRVALFSVTALGVSGSGFVNELAGARLELGYSPRFTLGFGLAYANLKGKDGRASNVLPEAMLGYRIPVSRVVGVPIQLAGGYLPKNGPTLRLGTGFDFRLGERAHLTLTLLEPMVWVSHDRPEASFDGGLALGMTL